MSTPEKNHPPLDPAATTAPRSAIKLSHVTGAVGALVVIGLIAGFIPRWHQRNALRAETAELAIPTVNVTAPTPGPAAPGLLLPGEIKPLVEATIYARANGYVKRWLVDIGAPVKEGELLAELDTPELNQELAQTKAELAQATAALTLAKTSADRWAELLKTASVSTQEAAEKDADYKLKTATVEAAQANLHRLEDLQSFARVTAPFAGTITARRIDVGDLIAAGSTKELFHLVQTRTLRVYVRVPQTLAHSIAPGQSAEVTIPELPGRVFPAKVVRTAGAMAADSRTLLTELEMDNAKAELLTGSYAQVRFLDMKLDAVLTLPSTTVIFRAEGTQVGIVKADGTVELRPIKIGRDFGPVVEILGGVQSIDRVILNPSDSLVNGALVRVAEAPKTPVTK